MNNKHLIVGSLHGDEPLGSLVVKKAGGVIGNPAALKIGKRFVETDMNRSFGVKTPKSLEEKLAAKLMPRLKKAQLVIDIHQTEAYDCSCVIVVDKPNKLQISLAKYFGIKRLVIMPPSGSLVSINPQKSVSLEYSKKVSDKKLVDYLVKRVKLLEVKKLVVGSVLIFEYVGRVRQIDLERCGIDKNRLENFKRIKNSLVKKLGFDSIFDYYPLFLKKNKDEEVVFTLLKRIIG